SCLLLTSVVPLASTPSVLQMPRTHKYLHSFPTRRSSDLLKELRITPPAIIRMREELNQRGFHLSNDLLSIEELAKAVASEVKSQDRKSTRLNSSHVSISYAVFCLKKKIVSCSRYSTSIN